MVNQDARRFVQESSAKYDLIIVDCYYADSLPSHLTTREFLAEAKARMEPDGVLAYNVISSVSGDGSKLFRSMYRTASGTWRRLWVFPIGIGEGGDTAQRRNVIVLATDSALAEQTLRSRIRERAGGRVRLPEFPAFERDLWTGILPMGDVPELTDAYAPTDSLIEVQ